MRPGNAVWLLLAGVGLLLAPLNLWAYDRSPQAYGYVVVLESALVGFLVALRPVKDAEGCAVALLGTGVLGVAAPLFSVASFRGKAIWEEEQPLTLMLLACPVGYALGHSTRRLVARLSRSVLASWALPVASCLVLLSLPLMLLSLSNYGVPEKLVRQLSACDSGSGDACFWFAMAYSKGDGVARDAAQAAAAFRRACDQEFPAGCYQLGVAHSNGDGVPKDAARAATALRKACDQGHGGGCYSLGVASSTGEGVAKDPAGAVALFLRACQRGETLGCGAGRRACNGGDVSVCAKLATILAERGDMALIAAPHGAAVAAELYRKGGAPGTADNLERLREAQIECYSGDTPACDDLVAAARGDKEPARGVALKLLAAIGRPGP